MLWEGRFKQKDVYFRIVNKFCLSLVTNSMIQWAERNSFKTGSVSPPQSPLLLIPVWWLYSQMCLLIPPACGKCLPGHHVSDCEFHPQHLLHHFPPECFSCPFYFTLEFLLFHSVICLLILFIACLPLLTCQLRVKKRGFPPPNILLYQFLNI